MNPSKLLGNRVVPPRTPKSPSPGASGAAPLAAREAAVENTPRARKAAAPLKAPISLKNKTAAAEPVKLSFRDKQFALREEAIIDAVNRQLTSRGYELMVLDDIAAEVGVAKGSLYKHFESKEALAGAAMKRLLQRLLVRAQELSSDKNATALDQLRALLRWALQERAAGRLPTLPSTNTALVKALMSDKTYMSALSGLTDSVGALIEKAMKAKLISAKLPVPVVMFSIYSKSCDPTFDYLRATQSFSDEEVIEFMVKVCFEGLS
jgi:TetR/AcrR family transcriptional regulator, regulator of autoinduction and epiphytic fitness